MSPDSPASLVEVLRFQAARRPEKIAFRFLDRGERETQTLTYAQLDRRARLIGRALHERGVEGRRLILAYPPGLEAIAAIFGCFYAGAAVILAPMARHGNGFERVRLILEDSQAAFILCLEAMPPDLVDDATGLLFTDALPEDDDFTPSPASPQTLAALQYTSGSTGRPRAVMLTHAHLMHNQAALQSALRSGSDDVAVSWLPLYHDMGLIGAVLQSVYVGGECVLMAPLAFLQKPLRWLQAISAYRATISMAPAFAYELCARFAHREPAASLDLSCWTAAICGGETIRARVLATFANRFEAVGFDARALTPAYGLAEATLLATCLARGVGLRTHERGGAEENRVCCGQTWGGQEVAIVDPDRLSRRPPGTTGEIWLRGGSVAAGYWNRPVETAATFDARLADDEAALPWLRTGDLGYLGPDGLVVTGRAKDVIIFHGANIDPQDLENAAQDCDPCLVAGAAFAWDGEDGVRIVLVQEMTRGGSIDAGALVGGIVAALSRDFGVTLHDLVWVRPGALPRTTSGKIQRAKCRETYLAGALTPLAPVDHPGLGRCRPARPGDR